MRQLISNEVEFPNSVSTAMYDRSAAFTTILHSSPYPSSFRPTPSPIIIES